MIITKSIASKAYIALVAVMFAVFSTNATVLAQRGGGDDGDGGGAGNPGVCVWSNEEGGIYKWSWRGSVGESTYNFAYTGSSNLSGREKSAWCLDQRTVTPAVVTFVNATCDALGSYTIPKSDGVKYSIGDEVVAAGTYPVKEDTTVVVTAAVTETYFLDKDAVVEWTNKFVTPTDCAKDVPAVLGTATTTPQVTVTPVGAADAGGTGTVALVGLVGSTVVLTLGAVIRKLSL